MADGAWIWIHSTGRVIERAADGRPLRMLGIHTDITARKEAEARVARSEQLLARMSRVSRTGGWDHDLRTGRSIWSDEMFRILMGDKVEPRREFIERHALEVRNLDV